MCLNVRSCTALASFVWSNRSPLHCNLENNLGAMQPYLPFYCDLFLWVLKLVFLNKRVSAWKGVCWHESARQKENIKFRYKHSLWLQWRKGKSSINCTVTWHLWRPDCISLWLFTWIFEIFEQDNWEELWRPRSHQLLTLIKSRTSSIGASGFSSKLSSFFNFARDFFPFLEPGLPPSLWKK